MAAQQQNTEQDLGNNVQNGNQNQNQNQGNGNGIPSQKLHRMTPIRKELIRQFVEMHQTTLQPGSDIWADELLSFFLSKGQVGVSRDSVKVWFGRQPSFFKPVTPRTETGAGTSSTVGSLNSNGNSWSFNSPPQTNLDQQQPSFQNYETSMPFQLQMPMPMPISSSAQNQGPISIELTDYQQKRADFNNAFEYIRQLYDIFSRQENLSTCLIHLEKIAGICGRANSKLVLPSTYQQNSKERLGALAKKIKPEMGTSTAVNVDENAVVDETNQDEEMIILP